MDLNIGSFFHKKYGEVQSNFYIKSYFYLNPVYWLVELESISTPRCKDSIGVVGLNLVTTSAVLIACMLFLPCLWGFLGCSGLFLVVLGCSGFFLSDSIFYKRWFRPLSLNPRLNFKNSPLHFIVFLAHF